MTRGNEDALRERLDRMDARVERAVNRLSEGLVELNDDLDRLKRDLWDVINGLEGRLSYLERMVG